MIIDKKQQGFTLIELMIVVVLIGVVAAIALPAMNNNKLKTNRAIAKTVLLEVQSRQEQFFLNSKAYTNDLTRLDTKYTSPLYVDDNGNPVAQANGLYEISITLDTPSTYTITAAPINSQGDDTDCGDLTLQNTGAKGATGARGTAGCW